MFTAVSGGRSPEATGPQEACSTDGIPNGYRCHLCATDQKATHGLPSDTCPSRSQRAKPLQKERLLAEVEVIWADPAAKDAPFLREAFTNHLPDWPYLRAYSVDSRGMVCRIFYAGETSWAAYRELRRQGDGTCPIEGVLPSSIAPGVPALPAHPFLLKELGR